MEDAAASPHKSAGAQKQAAWRKANSETEKFQRRMHKVANGLVRCERRILYAQKNEADTKRPSTLAKHKKQVDFWIAKREKFRAEMRVLIGG